MPQIKQTPKAEETGLKIPDSALELFRQAGFDNATMWPSRRRRVCGDRVTTYKTYHGTHESPFLGIASTDRKIHFESFDVMRVQNGKITDHWSVGSLLSLMLRMACS